jgi:hypothetical protein
MTANLTQLPYGCAQIVYRAQIFEDWVKNGRVKHQAFTRLRKDTVGLSVGPTPEDSRAGLSNPIFGYISLHVGRVRSIGLDVVPDSPTHGNITGVPFREVDHAEHGRLTRLLAEMARPVPI